MFCAASLANLSNNLSYILYRTLPIYVLCCVFWANLSNNLSYII